MFNLKFNIYFFVKSEKDKEVYRSVKPIENVRFEFRELKAAADFKPMSGFGATVITDDADFANKVAGISAAGNQHVRAIYCGDSEDVKEHFGNGVIDIWPAEESPETRAVRFELLIERLADKFGYLTYKSLLETTINTSPDLVWFKRKDGIHTLVNDVFAETVEKDKEDIKGKDHYYIWNVEKDETSGADDCSESEDKVIREGRMLSFDEQVKTHGLLKQLVTYKSPVYDWFGNVWGTVGYGHDVTDFSNMGIELSILIDAVPFPVILFDEDWNVYRMNEEFKGILEACGDDLDEEFHYLPWKEKRIVPIHMQEYDEERNAILQEVSIDILGSPWIYIITEQEVHDSFENITGYLVLFQDVTFQRTYEQTILNAANTDVLTGLFNRRYFYEYINDHSREPMMLLYMDLDHFKAVNDTYGHARGDEVLKKTATYIRSFFPEGVASRLGGDEYAVILMGRQNQDALMEKCKEMEKAVRSIPCGGDLYVTLSIGWAETNGDTALSGDEMIQLADQRMYDMKAQHHAEQQ